MYYQGALRSFYISVCPHVIGQLEIDIQKTVLKAPAMYWLRAHPHNPNFSWRKLHFLSNYLRIMFQDLIWL